MYVFAYIYHITSFAPLCNFIVYFIITMQFFPHLTSNLATPAVGICIINPNSGPGKRADPNYVSQTKAAQTAGVCCWLFYHTITFSYT